MPGHRVEWDGWLNRRGRNGMPMDGVQVHSAKAGPDRPHVDFGWRFNRSVPGTGVFACWIGGLMGYSLVVTNMQIDIYPDYHWPVRAAVKRGLFSHVMYHAPGTDPQGGSYFGSLVPRVSAEALRRAGNPMEAA
jgi:hypothetical protein